MPISTPAQNNNVTKKQDDKKEKTVRLNSNKQIEQHKISNTQENSNFVNKVGVLNK